MPKPWFEASGVLFLPNTHTPSTSENQPTPSGDPLFKKPARQLIFFSGIPLDKCEFFLYNNHVNWGDGVRRDGCLRDEVASPKFHVASLAFSIIALVDQ
jgi:hypothetical protein